MKPAFRNAAIVYCSPAGSTRHVAEVIRDTLKELDVQVEVLDMAKGGDSASILSKIKAAGEDTCLFIGSPVYVNHAVPPVTAFISELPESANTMAVPFVTWGGACSGVALWEMGKMLSEKGYQVAGAAKVMALHSMMWQFDKPVGEGRPNAEDDQMIRDMVTKVAKGEAKGIALSALAYQPEAAREEMEKSSLAMAKSHMPQRTVNEERCTQCNICAEVCPVEAVTFSPYPEFGDHCISCFNCVRECPEDAIEADFSPLDARIRAKAKQFDEQPLSQTFFNE